MLLPSSRPGGFDLILHQDSFGEIVPGAPKINGGKHLYAHILVGHRNKLAETIEEQIMRHGLTIVLYRATNRTNNDLSLQLIVYVRCEVALILWM